MSRGKVHFKSYNATKVDFFCLSDPSRDSLGSCAPLQSSWGALNRNPDSHLWLPIALQAANQDNNSKQDNRNNRETTVSLAHCHLCKHINNWRSGWSRYRYLEARLARIGIHVTKHYIAEELLTSQDGESGSTERLCADWVFRCSCPCDHWCIGH